MTTIIHLSKLNSTLQNNDFLVHVLFWPLGLYAHCIMYKRIKLYKDSWKYSLLKYACKTYRNGPLCV